MFRLFALSLFSLITLFCTNNLDAAIITTPTGLNPGDQYRLAFVTSGTRDGPSEDLTVYDSFVQAAADANSELAALGATWKVIGSNHTVDARDHTDTNQLLSTGVAIYLLNDSRLADSNADLWDGTIDAPLNITETGAVLGSNTNYVRTGTKADGTKANEPFTGGGIAVGLNTSTDSGWVIWNSGLNRGADRHLYAISSVLTAPNTAVPEPTTLAIWSLLGGIGLVVGHRRRRRRAA